MYRQKYDCPSCATELGGFADNPQLSCSDAVIGKISKAMAKNMYQNTGI